MIHFRTIGTVGNFNTNCRFKSIRSHEPESTPKAFCRFPRQKPRISMTSHFIGKPIQPNLLELSILNRDGLHACDQDPDDVNQKYEVYLKGRGTEDGYSCQNNHLGTCHRSLRPKSADYEASRSHAVQLFEQLQKSLNRYGPANFYDQL